MSTGCNIELFRKQAENNLICKFSFFWREVANFYNNYLFHNVVSFIFIIYRAVHIRLPSRRNGVSTMNFGIMNISLVRYQKSAILLTTWQSLKRITVYINIRPIMLGATLELYSRILGLELFLTSEDVLELFFAFVKCLLFILAFLCSIFQFSSAA